MDKLMDRAALTIHKVFGKSLSDIEALQEYPPVSLRHVYGEIWSRSGFDLKNRSLITVCVLVAMNREEELRLHIKGALHLGWTPEELAELMLHLSYYLGFAAGGDGTRILNSICGADSLKMTEEVGSSSDESYKKRRLKKSLATAHGLFGEVLPAIGVPYEFLKASFAHIYGEIWSREALDLKTRSLITITAMVATANLTQLRTHIEGAQNIGCTYVELTELMIHLSYYVGYAAGIEGANVLEEVFNLAE